MKKLLSTASLLAVAAILTVASFAASTITSTTAGSNTATANVTVNSKDSAGNEINDSDITTVYSVSVAFDSLAFEYKFDATKTEIAWDPTNLKYVKASDGTDLTGSWTSSSANVVVKNSSNAKVAITAKFAGNVSSATKSGVTSTIATTDSETLSSAVGATAATLPKVTYTVSVSGQPTSLDLFTVDTVTVTVSSVS